MTVAQSAIYLPWATQRIDSPIPFTNENINISRYTNVEENQKLLYYGFSCFNDGKMNELMKVTHIKQPIPIVLASPKILNIQVAIMLPRPKAKYKIALE